MPYKLIGRTTDLKGKSLWEILGNLKKFGVSRVVSRNMFKRYPESTYMKILKVEALSDVGLSFEIRRKVIALVEKTFRGINLKKPVQLESASYKTDYFLIHKYKELQFIKPVNTSINRIFNNEMEFPPLVKEYINQQMKIKATLIVKQPKMKVIYNETGVKKYRAATEINSPTEEELSMGLNLSITPRLYNNIIK